MTRRVRSLALVFNICCAALNERLAGQGQDVQRLPTFRSGADFVTLEVAVVDRNGKPLAGLTADDFVVTLDGQTRAVRALNYREITRASSSISSVSSASSAPAVRNGASVNAPATSHRSIFLLFDDLSARPADMIGLRIAAQRMLPSLDANDRVGVTTTSGLGPNLAPTTDRSALLSALSNKTLVGRYDDEALNIWMTIPEAIEVSRGFAHELTKRTRNYGDKDAIDTYSRVVTRECNMTDGGETDSVCMTHVITASLILTKRMETRSAEQIEAYTRIINAMAPASAPKVLIALSTGVAAGAMQGNLHDLDPISLAAARAGVQFYALTEAAEAGPADRSPEHAKARRQESDYMLNSMKSIAAAAGGEAFAVVGQADRFFSRIVDETSATYLLGVAMPDAAAQNPFMKVAVAVKRKDVVVRTNTRALSPSAALAPASPASAPAAMESALDARVRTLLEHGGTAADVTLTSAVSLRQTEAGEPQLAVSARIPFAAAAPLVMKFALVDAQGRAVKSGQQTITQPAKNDDYWAAFAIAADEGAYRLHIVVSDPDGNIGAVDEAVNIARRNVGGIAVSDLLVRWSDGSAAPRLTAFETLPASAESIDVALELYRIDAARRSQLKVIYEVRERADAEPIATVTPQMRNAGTGVMAEASLAIAALDSGTYILTARIFNGATDIGTVTRQIKKQR